MGYRSCKVYVSKPFASYIRPCNLNATSVAYGPLKTLASVFSTQTFVIFYGTEDLCTEKTVLFRFVGSVIYGLWLFYLPIAPAPYLLRRGKHELYSFKGQKTFSHHCSSSTSIWSQGMTAPFSHLTSSPKAFSSRTRTLKDSGTPGWYMYLPLTMDS